MKAEKERNKTRENIESLVIAILLALIIRATVVEAFVVPSDSMAPTIYGTHLERVCGNCGYRLDRSWNEGRWKRPESVECPVCDETAKVGFFNYSSGDRLLVNKFVHKIKPLSRWDIVVFKYPGTEPGRAGKNYIKRLTGLPGESVQVKRGDLYVNGKIERKPLGVQQDMWIKVVGHDFLTDTWKNSWEQSSGNVSIQEGILRLEGRESAALYLRESVDDGLFYKDGDLAAVSDVVNDVRMVLEAELDSASELTVEIASRFRFVVASGSGSSGIFVGEGDPVWTGQLNIDPGEHVIECLHVDAALYLIVDGKYVGGFEYRPESLKLGARDSGLGFGVAKGSVGIRRVDVFRDVYYCSLGSGKDYGVKEPFDLASVERDPISGKILVENEYFFLGDNSRSSSDSRDWKQVKESRIRGKAVVRFWPPLRVGIVR